MVMGLVVLVLAAQPEVCCSTVDECFTRLSANSDGGQCEARALAAFGGRVVPRLLALLSSDDRRAREGAANALVLIKPVPNTVVPAVIACLQRFPDGAVAYELNKLDDPRAAPAIVSTFARGVGYFELKSAIWNAALLPAVEALVSPTTDNRDIILQLLQDQPESKPSLDVARALHRQLRRLANARPSARSSACEQHRRPNSIQLGPCLPTTGYLMLALERFGPEAGFAITDIERALAKDPDALEVVASVALVSLGAPSARARITQKLASATVETVEDGLFEFMHFPPEGTLPVLVKGLLTHPAPRVAGLARYALARRGDSSGLDAAKAELSSVDYDRVELALATISSLGKLAPDGPSLMQQVLKNHPSARIRQVAARALGPVDGLEVPVPPVDCGVRRGEFAGLPSSLVHTVGDTFLIGTDNGEWGGELVEQRDGHDRKIAANINVRGFFTKGSTVFVFDGLEHLRRVGHVWRVVHEGGTHLELVTDLPGSPHAWRLDGSTLTVITHGELQAVDCKERVFSVVLP